MSHIFISYSRKDIEFAQRIVDTLAANNLDTWIDWKSIPKGEDWEREIYGGIEEADAFLFLISPDSIRSQMCNREIAHAVRNGKRILPIVLRDSNLNEFLTQASRKAISKRNWIFCRAGLDNFRKAITEIRKTIHTDYEWMKYHTELLVKAIRWKQHDDASRLLRGKELEEAEARIVNAGSRQEPQPTDFQRQFVNASRRAENNRIEMELKQAQALADEQRKRAEEQERLRLGNLSIVLASQADSFLDIYQEGSEKGPLLALQAYDFHTKYQSVMVSLIDKALRKSLGYWRYSPSFSAAVPSGADPEGVEPPFSNPNEMFNTGFDGFLSTAYSRDGLYLAIARSSGVIQIWLADMLNPIAESVSRAYSEPLTTIPPSGGKVVSMSFREGDLLGVLRESNSLTIYRVDGRSSSELARAPLPPLEIEPPDISSGFSISIYRKITCPIVFCSAQKRVAAANRNIAYVWDYEAGGSKPVPLKRPDFAITDPFNDPQIVDLVYSPDEEIVVLWSEGVVAWYSGSSLELVAEIQLGDWYSVHSYGYGHSYRYANSILSSTGRWIASCGMSADRPPKTTAYVWRIPETHSTGSDVLPPHYSETLDAGRLGLEIAFSQDEKYLGCWVSGGFRLWQVGLLEALKSRNELYRHRYMSSPDAEPADAIKDVDVFSRELQQGSVPLSSISENGRLFFSQDNSLLFCTSGESIVTGYLNPNPELSSLVVLDLQPIATVLVGVDGREVMAQELDQDPGLQVTPVSRDPVKDIRFTSDGNYLLILDAIDRLHIWKLNDFRGVPETRDLKAAGKQGTSRSYSRIADLGVRQFAVFGHPGPNDRGRMPVVRFDKREHPRQAVAFQIRINETGINHRPESIMMTNRSVRSVLEDGSLLTCRTSQDRVISRTRRKFVAVPDLRWDGNFYFGEFDRKAQVYIQASTENEVPSYVSRNRTFVNQVRRQKTGAGNAKGKLIETRLAERSRMTAFAVAQDGMKSACGHENGVISITEFAPERPAISYELISGQRSISVLASSADGSLLASSGGDKSIKIWDLMHPKQAPVSLMNPGDRITRLAFSSDNRLLVSVDAQGIVRLWVLPLENLARALKKLVTRKLSESEWLEFVGEDTPYDPVT